MMKKEAAKMKKLKTYIVTEFYQYTREIIVKARNTDEAVEKSLTKMGISTSPKLEDRDIREVEE